MRVGCFYGQRQSYGSVQEARYSVQEARYREASTFVKVDEVMDSPLTYCSISVSIQVLQHIN